MDEISEINDPPARTSKELLDARFLRASLEANHLFPQTHMAIALTEELCLLNTSVQDLHDLLLPVTSKGLNKVMKGMLVAHGANEVRTDINTEVMKGFLNAEKSTCQILLLTLLNSLKTKEVFIRGKTSKSVEEDLINFLNNSQNQEITKLAKKLLEQAVKIIRRSQDLSEAYKTWISERVASGNYVTSEALENIPMQTLKQRIFEGWKQILGENYPEDFCENYTGYAFQTPRSIFDRKRGNITDTSTPKH